jgi:hypothetical protein
MDLKKTVAAILVLAFLAGSLAVTAGCDQGKPKVVVFLGKSSKSYAETKAMVDKAKKKFGDKVIFEEYDYDSPTSDSAKKKYSVSMNPTVIITNTAGQVKQTFMGKPMEDDLIMTIQSFIPGENKPATSTPGSTPGTTVVPGTPYPPGSTPAVPVPITTAPQK